ncbi:hypothetical protein RQN30_09570 [Arcanobacterium hippocoleae]
MVTQSSGGCEAEIPDNVQMSWKRVRFLRNDPRTTLLIAAIINITVMGSASNLVLITAAMLVGALFASVSTLRGVFTFYAIAGFFIFLQNTARCLEQVGFQHS